MFRGSFTPIGGLSAAIAECPLRVNNRLVRCNSEANNFKLHRECISAL
jgi:hypothetical protein